MKAEMNCFVIYGYYEGLNQWHIAAIIPENFSTKNTALLTDINKSAISLAYGGSQVIEYLRGQEIPLFF